MLKRVTNKLMWKSIGTIIALNQQLSLTDAEGLTDFINRTTLWGCTGRKREGYER